MSFFFLQVDEMLRKDNLGQTQEVKQTYVFSHHLSALKWSHIQKSLWTCEFIFAEVSVEQHAVCCCYDLMFVALKRDIAATVVDVNKLDVLVVNHNVGLQFANRRLENERDSSLHSEDAIKDVLLSPQCPLFVT